MLRAGSEHEREAAVGSGADRRGPGRDHGLSRLGIYLGSEVSHRRTSMSGQLPLLFLFPA
jgi:hypothetical protein